MTQWKKDHLRPQPDQPEQRQDAKAPKRQDAMKIHVLDAMSVNGLAAKDTPRR
jgi:hypothetical protein